MCVSKSGHGICLAINESITDLYRFMHSESTVILVLYFDAQLKHFPPTPSTHIIPLQYERKLHKEKLFWKPRQQAVYYLHYILLLLVQY